MAFAVICALSAASASASATSVEPVWIPDAMFVQAGFGTHVDSNLLGLSWNTGWRRDFDIGSMELAAEVTIGQWRTSAGAHDEHFTVVGASPVLRFYPRALGSNWFFEAGVGLNSISPLYRNGTRDFSTRFNFGDQVAIGRRFGSHGSQEVSLRVEHFSNGGIKTPNPGENFLQLRYTMRF